MHSLDGKRLAIFTLVAASLMGGVTAIPLAVGQTQDSDRYITVDGWAVNGYAGDKRIGYAWYPDRGEAEAAKAKMEKIETTNGKYYDRVEITPERRRQLIERPRTAPAVNSPTLPSTPRPGGVVRPASPLDLRGTTWRGTESASDTNSLKFVFGRNNDVTAYDDTGSVWRGTWKMIGQTNVVIELTSPNRVNYSGQINGDQITGTAGRPGRGQWRFSVQR